MSNINRVFPAELTYGTSTAAEYLSPKINFPNLFAGAMPALFSLLMSSASANNAAIVREVPTTAITATAIQYASIRKTKRLSFKEARARLHGEYHDLQHERETRLYLEESELQDASIFEGT